VSRLTSEELLDEYPSLRLSLETSKKIEDEVVMVDEFPGNSQRRIPAKPEPEKKAPPEKNIQKVVSGEVVQRKPSMAKRVKAVFLGGDTQSVKDYVILEVVVPAFKDTIADAVTGAIERMVFGDNVRPGRRGSRYAPGPANNFNNYAGISNRNFVPGAAFNNDPRGQLSRQARSQHQFDEVIFPSRADAHAVLTQMFELLDQFEVVTVSDFLELSGISGNFTDHKFGWTDLRGVQAHRTRGGGFVLGLPPTEPID
jgi:hypothetical protein